MAGKGEYENAVCCWNSEEDGWAAVPSKERVAGGCPDVGLEVRRLQAEVPFSSRPARASLAALSLVPLSFLG